MDAHDVRRGLEGARSRGAAVRVHTVDGEVIVARVLECDAEELVYAVISSSRPERYAVCDSTGFRLAIEAISQVEALACAPEVWRAVLPDDR